MNGLCQNVKHIFTQHLSTVYNYHTQVSIFIAPGLWPGSHEMWQLKLCLCVVGVCLDALAEAATWQIVIDLMPH